MEDSEWTCLKNYSQLEIISAHFEEKETQRVSSSTQTDDEEHFCISLNGRPYKVFHSRKEVEDWIFSRCREDKRILRNGDCIRRYQGEKCIETIIINSLY